MLMLSKSTNSMNQMMDREIQFNCVSQNEVNAVPPIINPTTGRDVLDHLRNHGIKGAIVMTPSRLRDKIVRNLKTGYKINFIIPVKPIRPHKRFTTQFEKESRITSSFSNVCGESFESQTTHFQEEILNDDKNYGDLFYPSDDE